jgi:GNAT superfamily N-acetyltransferase
MHFSPVTVHDLDDLKILQPPDWSDIIPDIRYYIEAGFCYPLKVIVDGEIAGLGAAIVYGETAWLAHIIVHSQFRNKGIGYTIVKELLNIINNMKVSSCLLTATVLGKPVYLKAGFKSISEYVFLNRVESWNDYPISENIRPYKSDFTDQIYQIDKRVSGEDRRVLLDDFISESQVYIQQNKVLGYSIPTLKEGPIIAITKEAGLELMKVKYRTSEKAVIPAENISALEFLQANGFKPMETRGTRMMIGNEISWEPTNIYSRAGGNFG